MVDGEVFHQDATLEWPYLIDSLDAVITSPPFFDSTRYYLSNWIRLWFSGWEKEDFHTKPLRFLELRQKETMRVYEEVFRQSRERLKTDGVLVLHLGKVTRQTWLVNCGKSQNPGSEFTTCLRGVCLTPNLTE